MRGHKRSIPYLAVCVVCMMNPGMVVVRTGRSTGRLQRDTLALRCNGCGFYRFCMRVVVLTTSSRKKPQPNARTPGTGDDKGSVALLARK